MPASLVYPPTTLTCGSIEETLYSKSPNPIDLQPHPLVNHPPYQAPSPIRNSLSLYHPSRSLLQSSRPPPPVLISPPGRAPRHVIVTVSPRPPKEAAAKQVDANPRRGVFLIDSPFQIPICCFVICVELSHLRTIRFSQMDLKPKLSNPKFYQYYVLNKLELKPKSNPS